MTNYETCRICDNIAHKDFTDTHEYSFPRQFIAYTATPDNWRYYCSKGCKYSETGKNAQKAGFIMILISLISLVFFQSFEYFLVFLLFSVGLLVYGFLRINYSKSAPETPKVPINKRIIADEEQFEEEGFEIGEEKIYEEEHEEKQDIIEPRKTLQKVRRSTVKRKRK